MCVIPPSLTHPVLPSFLLFLVPSCLQSPSLSPSSSYLPLVLLSFFVFSFPIVPVSYSVPSFVWVFEVSLSQTFVAPFTFSHFVLLRSSVPAFSFFSCRSPCMVWSVPFRSSALRLGKLWLPSCPSKTWIRNLVTAVAFHLFLCLSSPCGFADPIPIRLYSKLWKPKCLFSPVQNLGFCTFSSLPYPILTPSDDAPSFSPLLTCFPCSVVLTQILRSDTILG